MKYTSCTLLVFFLALSQLSFAALDCLNGNGSPISWWSALKLPQSVGMNRHLYYDYSDDQAGSQSFKIVNSQVDSESTPLYKTLDQLNHFSRYFLYITAFNDEHPDGKTANDNAYSKGVIAWDRNSGTGFYLMHSAPKYPIVDDTHVQPKLPSNAWKSGQNFFCVSIDSNGLNALKQNIAISHPNVYYDNSNWNPSTDRLAGSGSTDFRARLSGQSMTYLSKNPNNQISFLYEDIISPHFGDRFMVESWSHPGQAPLCDRKYPSVNIGRITHQQSGVSFIEGDDHSKWAISYTSSKMISCSGDMNRAADQAKRGGCALCLNSNKNYYSALRNLIAKHDDCPSFAVDDDFLNLSQDLKQY